MSTKEEEVKEIPRFVLKNRTLKILLAEDNLLIQAIAIDRIGNTIDENIVSILTKLRVPFTGVVTCSREKQGKDLILSYKDNEKTVLTIEIRLAVNGEQAVNFFKKHSEQGEPFNVVLMNHHMPKPVGSEAIEIIREYEAKTALKLSLIIGWTTDKVSGELMVAKGANEFYLKETTSEAIGKLVLEGIFDLPKIREILVEEPPRGLTP